ncbi:palmitoyltransferase ZDHHC13 isoform 2-T2 [Discoglossus pictus]
MIILLIKFGADPTLIDGEGYSSIHLAVLFQHLPVIAYLTSKGLNIDTPNMNGLTPLMLSAKQVIGMEPTNFLLKFNPSLNAADKIHRNTALHWAVSSGNDNAVDLLLEAGSSLDVQNAKGDTPLDIARQNRNRLIAHLLTNEMNTKASRSSRILKIFQNYEMSFIFLVCMSLIGGVGYILDMHTDSWLLKGTLLALLITGSQLLARRLITQNSQKYLPAAVLVGSVFWVFITWFICFVPDLSEAAFQMPFILIVILFLYYFYKTWRTDPGYIKLSEEERRQTIITLAESGLLDYRMFCTSCLVKKPLRSMHCHACGSCVAKFDHHCIWTGQCIGAGNQHFFVMFLGSLVLLGYWIIFATSIHWRDNCITNKEGFWDNMLQVITCSPWIAYIFGLVSCLTIWASLMLIVQIYQIAFLGLTTQERINLQIQNRHGNHKVSLRRTPFNHGCIQNLADFFQCQCFGLIKANRVDWTKQYHVGIDPSKMRRTQAV